MSETKRKQSVYRKLLDVKGSADMEISNINHRNRVATCNTNEWSFIPENVLINIFKCLSAKEILNSGETCSRWNFISNDSSLWKYRFRHDYKVNRNVPRKPGSASWFDEYKRLCENVPVVLTEVLTQHTDEVLHVSFSHNGQMFATCSKDGMIIVWECKAQTTVKHWYDMRKLGCQYTQYSQFNSSDTLILVGCISARYSNTGEVAIFSLVDGFQLKRRVKNNPFNVFATWLDDSSVLSGDLVQLDSLASKSTVKVIQANQYQNSSGVSNVYNFLNQNGAWIRFLTVANLKTGNNSEQKFLIFVTGERTCAPHQIGIKRIIRSETESDKSDRDHFNPDPHLRSLNPALPHYDTVDHLFDLNGCMIGMTLSPDNRFLYANSRVWPENCEISDPFDQPPISKGIVIYKIDLETMQIVETSLRGHRGFTPNKKWFFIFLDVSQNFVASGSEDNQAFIWDKHYETCLATYQHKNVVNSVAFNPKDDQMFVTVSDDHEIKIWRSRASIRNTEVTAVGIANEDKNMIVQESCHEVWGFT